MRTETAAHPVGPRQRYRVAAVLVLFCTGIVGLPLAWAQPDDTQVPWRDADLAATQLVAAQVRLLDARESLVVAESDLEQLKLDRGDANQETLVVAEQLQNTQDRARSLAVEAYINGGSAIEATYLLDAATANDFAYRSTLISEGADAVARSTSDYFEMRAEASAEELALADQIEEKDRAIEWARIEIAQAEAALADAEWVMTIAEIHRQADELLEQYGRVDPTEEQWEELRWCEAQGNYSTNTGNSFYGAYQFTVTTWIDMGGAGLPSNARPEEQDARARYLYALRGSGYNQGGSWPLCGRHLPR